jgi:hypothetical protein
MEKVISSRKKSQAKAADSEWREYSEQAKTRHGDVAFIANFCGKLACEILFL